MRENLFMKKTLLRIYIKSISLFYMTTVFMFDANNNTFDDMLSAHFKRKKRKMPTV